MALSASPLSSPPANCSGATIGSCGSRRSSMLWDCGDSLMKEIPVGAKGKFEQVVAKSHLASELEPSLAQVMSTPTMIGMMELAAMDAIKPYLDPGEGSVGISIDAQHTAATPPKHRVRAEAEVTKSEGRRLEFKVTAF